MSERLCSVGLDVGTTSTQLVVSELTVENRASSFAVPEMEISQRRILYQSPVYFTPLQSENRVDGGKIRELVISEYEKAGIRREDVDTGAVIITGETSRKENARTVMQALSDFAGEFVVATAGPDLESVLAAKGAGAAAYSQKTGKTVLHMDIGGGTCNLALIQAGNIVRTGCLNVGGRLIRLDETGTVCYVSPVLTGIVDLQPGDRPGPENLAQIAQLLVQALEMAAGLREPTRLLEQLGTAEAQQRWQAPEQTAVLSFSGGVADCMEREIFWLEYGDIGPLLGKAIAGSRLCRGPYMLGRETIRATVIGAGCHAAQLSGSTVFHQNMEFPLKNLPVIDWEPSGRLTMPAEEGEGPVVLALPGIRAPSYGEVTALAQTLASRAGKQLLLCLEQDMAKALGQALAVRMPRDAQILCIDRVRVGEGSYLDIGAPVACAFPVVVKTLVLGS